MNEDAASFLIIWLKGSKVGLFLVASYFVIGADELGVTGEDSGYRGGDEQNSGP